MKEQLKNVLIKNFALDDDAAEIVSIKVLDWVRDEARAVACTVRVSGKIAIAKFKGSDTLSISVTDSTNVPGGAIVAPGAQSYIVEFPLSGSCE